MPKAKKKIKVKLKETYPPAQWAQIRAFYESGLYASMNEVHLAAAELYKKSPSLKQMRDRCTAEGWNRVGYKERLDAAHERAIDQLFREEGMGDREIVRRVVAGIKHTDIVLEKVMKKIEDQKGSLTPETLDSLAGFLKDLRVQRAFIAEAAKMKGMYKRNNDDRSGPDGADDDLSYDEMAKEHERLSATLNS